MLHRFRPLRLGVRLMLGLLSTALIGVAGESTLPSSERGQIKTTFVPAPAEEGVRRMFNLALDAHGRVLAANGRVLRYDGFTLEELPVPGGGYTGAVAVDSQDRVWIGNHEQLGRFEPDATGGMQFVSVRDALPTEARDHGLIWAVHTVGDTVYFIASQEILEWRAGRFTRWPLPNMRRLFSTALDGSCYVWQRIQPKEGETSIPLWRFIPGQSPRLIHTGTAPNLGVAIISDGHGGILQVNNDGRFGAVTAGPADWRGPRWETSVITATRLDDGQIVLGSTSDGVRGYDSHGTLLWRLDTTDFSLPDNSVETLLRGRDGALWGLTPQGLVRMEPSSSVTYWRNAQGWPATVNAITRWQGQLYLAASQRSHTFRLESRGDGRPAAWHALQKLYEPSFGYDLLPSPTAGLVVAGEYGLWTSTPNGLRGLWYSPPHTGRSVFHWDETARELVYAQLDDLSLWQRAPAASAGWTMIWQEKFATLDHAYPWQRGEFFATDLAGRIWLYTFTHDAAGQPTLSAPPRRLTPETGLGRITRLERHGEWAVAFTRDVVWRWRAGETAFHPLPTDAPAGVVPATLRLEPGASGWALARLVPLPSGGDAVIRYGVFHAELADGRLRGLQGTPVSIVENIGWLSAAFSEEGVWWLGGTGGLARVALRTDLKPLTLQQTPLLQTISDGRGHALLLRDPAPLDGERSAVFRYSYPQSAHALPVAFQTQLAPLEADWLAPTGEHQRSYARLPGGDYVWKLRAIDAIGNTSPALTIPLRVAPRFLETTTGRFLVITAALALMGAFAWGWTRRLRLQRAQLEHTVGERTAALLATNAELHTQNQKRTELIGAVSHELRTPLTGAYLMAEKLAATETSGDAEHLRRCLAELRQMLEGTLDLSRYELGLIPMRLRWLRFEPVVQETVRLFAPLAAASGLTLDTRLAPAPGLVLADEANLRRVLSNLLSNAIKFTTQGRIEVTLAWSQAAPFTVATLTVCDTGRGMNAEEVARLFDGFQRIGLRRHDEIASAGLGLSLTKRLVDLAGGDIHCESTPGTGTTFTVALPMLGHDAGVEPTSPFAIEVLIVEDEAGHRDHATELLEPLGATVTTAGSVAAALALVKTKRFALALVDFNLPDGTGLELWQRWRSVGTLPARAVVLTSHRSESIRAICLAAGFNEVLAKPLSLRTAIQLLAAQR